MLISKKKPYNIKLKQKRFLKLNNLNYLGINSFYLTTCKNIFFTRKVVECIKIILRKILGKLSKIHIIQYSNVMTTSKPNDSRMGSGKGNNFHYFTYIKKGQPFIRIETTKMDLLQKILPILNYKAANSLILVKPKNNILFLNNIKILKSIVKKDYITI